VSTLKRDLNVTVRERDSGKPEHLEEPWAKKLGHQPVRIYVYELWYAASFVEAIILPPLTAEEHSCRIPPAGIISR
jgi:hypothetical protein